MNDATPRDAIAEVLSIEKRRPHTRQMIGGITAATWDEADAVIAHLWQAADDPEVVEAVAESWNGEFWGVYRADEPEESREYPLDRPFTDAVYGSGYEISSMHMATAGSTPTPDELHDLARSSIVATLTALLGPKPNGEEEQDGTR